MEDLISRQAAIDASCTCYDGVHCNHYPCKDVQAIMDLPSAQPEPCEDAVSRRRLLSDLKELTAAWGKYPVMAEQIKGVEAAIGYVETIPSVTPERKKGKWNAYYHGVNENPSFTYSCNQCGYSAPYGLYGGSYSQKKWMFCPNCGADMRGDQNETD